LSSATFPLIEVSTAFLFRENQKHGMDDRRTDGRSTTLNAASIERAA